MRSIWLLDNRSNALCSHDSPDEERDSGSRDHVSLDCKQMSDLVNRKPDRRQRKKPKEEERDEVAGVGT